MKKVFRVQDESGRGPFQPGITAKWICSDKTNLPPFYVEMPNVLNEIKKATQGHFGCGCTSIEQLEKWFNNTELNRLDEMGFHVVEIPVDRIICESLVQCVFYRKQALNIGIKKIKI